MMNVSCVQQVKLMALCLMLLFLTPQSHYAYSSLYALCSILCRRVSTHPTATSWLSCLSIRLSLSLLPLQEGPDKVTLWRKTSLAQGLPSPMMVTIRLLFEGFLCLGGAARGVTVTVAGCEFKAPGVVIVEAFLDPADERTCFLPDLITRGVMGFEWDDDILSVISKCVCVVIDWLQLQCLCCADEGRLARGKSQSMSNHASISSIPPSVHL